jgi:RNA 2',3'-cyclic 3'-phosphodiesterase
VSGARVRLFVAASVPEDRLLVLERAVRPLRKELPDARWAALESQHITLKFLGWTDVHNIDDVLHTVELVAARHAPAEVSLKEVGAFPNKRRARVVWAGIEDPARRLTSIAEMLDQLCEPLGYEREARAFTPHLTVARIKRPRPVDVKSIVVASDPWLVSAINLYRSHLSPRGARYEVLSAAELSG